MSGFKRRYAVKRMFVIAGDNGWERKARKHQKNGLRLMILN